MQSHHGPKRAEARLEPKTLSVGEASEYIGISKTSVWRLLANGVLPRIRVGGRTLIAVSDLNGLISTARSGVAGGSRR